MAAATQLEEIRAILGESKDSKIADNIKRKISETIEDFNQGLKENELFESLGLCPTGHTFGKLSVIDSLQDYFFKELMNTTEYLDFYLVEEFMDSFQELSRDYAKTKKTISLLKSLLED